MIKINLLEKKKPFKLPVILGLDLNEINMKPLVLVYLLGKGMELFVVPGFVDGLDDLKAQKRVVSVKLRKLKKDLKKDSHYNEILIEYEKQIQRLKEREIQVESIIKQKTNPKNILLSVTKVIPDNVWLNSFVIDKNSDLKLSGSSLRFDGIKTFIAKANELAFFERSVVTEEIKSSEEEIRGKKFRLQNFSVRAKIHSYGNLD